MERGRAAAQLQTNSAPVNALFPGQSKYRPNVIFWCLFLLAHSVVINAAADVDVDIAAIVLAAALVLVISTIGVFLLLLLLFIYSIYMLASSSPYPHAPHCILLTFVGQNRS